MGMKFVIGLTDQEDPSAFIDAPPIIESGVNVTSYNLYKQVPEPCHLPLILYKNFGILNYNQYF